MRTIFLFGNIEVFTCQMDSFIPEGTLFQDEHQTYVVQKTSLKIVTPEFPKNPYMQKEVQLRLANEWDEA